MAAHTVRLDDGAERTLVRRRKLTHRSISEVLKRGLRAYEPLASSEGHARPCDIYARLELGAGGWSIAPAWDAKRVVRRATRREQVGKTLVFHECRTLLIRLKRLLPQ